MTKLPFNLCALPRSVALLLLTIAPTTLLISGCDWVDSTGVQDSTPTILLDEGVPIRVDEQSEQLIDPTDIVADSDSVTNWRWSAEPLQSGDLPSCLNVEGYVSAYTVSTLQEACTDSANCNLLFGTKQVNTDGNARTVFELVSPILKASVGLTYQLFSSDADGVETEHNFTFCLISENEEPLAEADVHSVVIRETLDTRSLNLPVTANDNEDIDIQNLPLSVSVKREPQLAEFFQLSSDGHFVYQPLLNLVLPVGSGLTDSFEYNLTDGTHTTNATVTINIVEENFPPELLEAIPDSIAIVGIGKSLTFAEYFGDPEGSVLGFSIDPRTLPPSGNFFLTSAGSLVGTATNEDIGEWIIQVAASDGTATVSSEFSLTIRENLPPVALAIPDQGIDLNDEFSLEAADYFSDPEGVELIYSLSGVGTDTLIIDQRTGVVSGSFAVEGAYEITITATDGITDPVTSVVSIEVAGIPNRPPVYTGSIANQTIELGESINTIEGLFEDEDNDPLSYGIQGILPDGVTINAATGVVSGTPDEVGAFRNLRIVATDPSGERALSDTFTITVIQPVENRAPVYSGSIPNQTITLGSAIAPIEGNFSDPDGDELSYSIVGTLPAGLSLSDDGVVTGRPTRTTANMRLLATDPDGESARSDVFRISVISRPPNELNQAPEYLGSISDVEITAGLEMAPLSGNFSDPDDDELEYTMIGTLPDGVELDDDTGIISGTPEESGVFSALQIVATDPDDEFIASDRFTLTVLAGQAREVDGIVSINANRFNARQSAEDHSWVLQSDSDAIGGSRLQALPDIGTRNVLITGSPRLDYEVDFEEAGEVFVWIHGLGITDGNSLHLGINGVNPVSARRLDLPLAWRWSNDAQTGAAKLTVPSAGVHTINVWMREDGVAFDKLVLSRESDFTPQGDGPDETLP